MSDLGLIALGFASFPVIAILSYLMGYMLSALISWIMGD